MDLLILPRLLIPVEATPGETRVSATPETVKTFVSLGCSVCLERGAGTPAGYLDAAYTDQGADLVAPGDADAWSSADVLLCVQTPSSESLARLRCGALVVGLLNPYANEALSAALERGGLSAMALELLPRISRAQSMDALSSQALVAGYRCAVVAAGMLRRFFPLSMTAAGTVQPAKVVVLDAGVAGGGGRSRANAKGASCPAGAPA